MSGLLRVLPNRRYWSPTRLIVWGIIMCSATGAAILHFVQERRGAEIRPEDIQNGLRTPRLDGTHPCVYFIPQSATTKFGNCSTPNELSQSVDQFEADLRYGAFVVRQTDLEVSERFTAPLVRAYSSVDWAGTSQQHAFGFNTNHQYDIEPVGDRFPYTYLLLVLEDGDVISFQRISRGTGFSDAVFMHTESSTRFYKSLIAWNGHGWTLTFVNGDQVFFPEAYKAKNMAQGAPTEIRSAAGERLILVRDDVRNLREVRTPDGHWIRFSYDDEARITKAETDEGKWSRYQYNNGMLVNVTYSTGASRSYEYESRLMTCVRDNSGRIIVRNWYRSGRLIRQAFANGDIYQYAYTWNPNRTFPDLVRVTLPNGTERTITVAASVPDAVGSE